MWTKPEEQFQCKTWANKLQLRRKLYGLLLKEGESVNDHIKTMNTPFTALAVLGDPVTVEDRVYQTLSIIMLVTALEAQSESVPKWELVTERLLHEESKLRVKAPTRTEGTASSQRYPRRLKSFKCHFCDLSSRFKKDCRKFLATQSRKKQAASLVETNSDNDGEALVTTLALNAATTKGAWIVDSGATTHMCNDELLFTNLKQPQTPQVVTLSNGRSLEELLKV